MLNAECWMEISEVAVVTFCNGILVGSELAQ